MRDQQDRAMFGVGNNHIWYQTKTVDENFNKTDLTLRLLRKKMNQACKRGYLYSRSITPLILPRITWNFHIQLADHRWPFYHRRDGHVTRKSRDSHM